MAITMIAQARIYSGSGFNHTEHKKHPAVFLMEGLYQIFCGTLIDKASRVVMRPNDHEILPTVFHPCEISLDDGVERTQVV